MGAFSGALSTSHSEDVFAVTPADTDGITDGTTIRALIRQLYITTGGTVKYTSSAGIINTITVPSGFMLQCGMTRVWSTGTSATGLLGFV